MRVLPLSSLFLIYTVMLAHVTLAHARTVADASLICQNALTVNTTTRLTEVRDFQTGLLETLTGVVHELDAPQSIKVIVIEPKDRSISRVELEGIQLRVGTSLHRALLFYDGLTPNSAFGATLAQSITATIDLYHEGKVNPSFRAGENNIQATAAVDFAPIYTYDRESKTFSVQARSRFTIRQVLAHEAAHFIVYQWFPRSTYFKLMEIHEGFADYLAWLESDRSAQFLKDLVFDRSQSPNEHYRRSLQIFERLVARSSAQSTTAELLVRCGKILNELRDTGQTSFENAVDLLSGKT